MSFSTDVKDELTRLDNTKVDNVALLSAYIRQNAYIDDKMIRIHTENISICRYLFKIIKNLYDVSAKIIVRKILILRKHLLILWK